MLRSEIIQKWFTGPLELALEIFEVEACVLCACFPLVDLMIGRLEVARESSKVQKVARRGRSLRMCVSAKRLQISSFANHIMLGSEWRKST